MRLDVLFCFVDSSTGSIEKGVTRGPVPPPHLAHIGIYLPLAFQFAEMLIDLGSGDYFQAPGSYVTFDNIEMTGIYQNDKA
jgi:hypothetical protein